ncbi:TPA: hypothetical protein ACG0LC_004524, partial [Citrobacter sedlakii]
MLKIIRNDYFLADILISSLKRDNLNVEVIKLLPTLTVKRGVFEKVFIQRIKPAFKIIYLFLKRCFFSVFFKNKIREEAILYFAIDDFKTLVELISENILIRSQNLWLWNPCFALGKGYLDVRLKLLLLQALGVHIYTFDMKDSKKYKITYHNQIFSSEITKLVNTSDICANDNLVFFAGSNKGRIGILYKINTVLLQCGMSTQFYILDNNASPHSYPPEFILMDKNLSYHNYLEHLSKSGYLLEVAQS